MGVGEKMGSIMRKKKQVHFYLYRPGASKAYTLTKQHHSYQNKNCSPSHVVDIFVIYHMIILLLKADDITVLT